MTPTKNDIAQAMLIARRLLPEVVRSRLEFVALQALNKAYPDAKLSEMSREIGIIDSSNLYGRVASAKRSGWWPSGAVEAIARELAQRLEPAN